MLVTRSRIPEIQHCFSATHTAQRHFSNILYAIHPFENFSFLRNAGLIQELFEERYFLLKVILLTMQLFFFFLKVFHNSFWMRCLKITHIILFEMAHNTFFAEFFEYFVQF